MMELLNNRPDANPAQTRLVGLLRLELGRHTSAELVALVQRQEVPASLRQQLVQAVSELPALGRLNEDDVIAAARAVRPEFGRLLETPAGRLWMRKVAVIVAAGAGLRALTGLFG